LRVQGLRLPQILPVDGLKDAPRFEKRKADILRLSYSSARSVAREILPIWDQSLDALRTKDWSARLEYGPICAHAARHRAGRNDVRRQM